MWTHFVDGFNNDCILVLTALFCTIAPRTFASYLSIVKNGATTKNALLSYAYNSVFARRHSKWLQTCIGRIKHCACDKNIFWNLFSFLSSYRQYAHHTKHTHTLTFSALWRFSSSLKQHQMCVCVRFFFQQNKMHHCINITDVQWQFAPK